MKPRHRKIVVGLAAAVPSLLVANADGAPSNAIVPMKSIAGISLGIPKGAVPGLLGKPSEVQPWGGYYYKRGVEVEFGGVSTVKSIMLTRTAGARQPWATSTGIRLGSSAARARKAYPGMHCDGYRAATGLTNRIFKLGKAEDGDSLLTCKIGRSFTAGTKRVCREFSFVFSTTARQPSEPKLPRQRIDNIGLGQEIVPRGWRCPHVVGQP